jgi:hypothetical protein
MAPKGAATLNAEELQAQYSQLLSQPPYGEATSAYFLHKVLQQHVPPIRVTHGTVKQWWNKFRVSAGDIRLTSAAELQERYGDSIGHYAVEYPTAFKLCAALRLRVPPICIDDSIAKEWLRQYGGQRDVVSVHSAGHLELLHGDRIRMVMPMNSADGLASWLLSELKVLAPARICQYWLSKDWSSSGKLLTMDAVEEYCGERLRLSQYKDRFSSDDSAQQMAELLQESQPPFTVSVLLLRQW